MGQAQIIMNFTTAPSPDDLLVMAETILESLPTELEEKCEDLAVVIEEFADEGLEEELDLDDPFELLALYRSGSEIAPGVMSKVANDDDVLILFRRPILEMWCETGEPFSRIMREVIVNELGRYFEFSEDEIEIMSSENYQGMA